MWTKYYSLSVAKSCTCLHENHSTLNTLAHDKHKTFDNPNREIEKRSCGIEDGSDVDTSGKTDNDGDAREDVGWGGEDGAGGGGASDRLRQGGVVGHPPDIEGDDEEENAEFRLDIPGAIGNGGEGEEPAVAAEEEEEEEEEEEDEEELLLFSDSCGAANTANDNSTLATPTEEDADDEDEDNNSSSDAVAVAVVEQERLREEEANPDDEISAPELESTVLESADIDPEVEAEGVPSLEDTQERGDGTSGDTSKGEKMVAMESAHMVNGVYA